MTSSNLEGVLAQPTRRRIAEYVAQHPGASARGIQRALRLGWGETAYHLDQLVRGGALRRERTGRRDAYFDRALTWEDRRILVVLRGGRVRYLLLELASVPDLAFAELQRRLGVSKSTLSFHLTRLIAGGVVESFRTPEGRRYRLPRREHVAQMVRSYRESFEDRLIDRFIETWASLLPE